MAAADPELAGTGTAATTAAATAVNVSGEEEDLTRIGPQDEAQRAQVSYLIKPKILNLFIFNLKAHGERHQQHSFIAPLCILVEISGSALSDMLFDPQYWILTWLTRPPNFEQCS